MTVATFSRPQCIGEESFKTKKELRSFTMSKVIEAGKHSRMIYKNDDPFFFNLIQKHPRWPVKFSTAGNSFKAVFDPRNRRAAASNPALVSPHQMHAYLFDGTNMTFSWVQCCGQKHKPNLSLLSDAMHYAVHSFIGQSSSTKCHKAM